MLKCKGLSVNEMYSAVKAFTRKLQLLSSQVEENIFTHFPTLKAATRSADHLHKYSSMLEAVHVEFSKELRVKCTWFLLPSTAVWIMCQVMFRWNSLTCPTDTNTGRALQVSVTAGNVLFPQRGELSTPKEACSEDSPLWICTYVNRHSQ